MLGGTVGVRTRAEMGLRLFFALGDGEVKIGNYGLSSWGTVSRKKVILERCIGTLPRNVLSKKGAAGY